MTESQPTQTMPPLMVLPCIEIEISDVAIPGGERTNRLSMKNAICRADMIMSDEQVRGLITGLQAHLDKHSGLVTPTPAQLLGPDGVPL